MYTPPFCIMERGPKVDHPRLFDSSIRVIGSLQGIVHGQFAGQTIRAELQELQKAELGRKYANADRRPLDPPPVVLLRIFHASGETTSAGVGFEEEVPCEKIRNQGIICTVDLIPVPEFPAKPGLHGTTNNVPNGDDRNALTFYTLYPINSTTGKKRRKSDIRSPQSQTQQFASVLNFASHYALPEDVVHRYGNHLITEASTLTSAIVGEKFVESATVDYNGTKSLVFTFGDLAIQQEGTFILRYRVFDIFSKTHENEHSPILAELYGGPFKVYSTREFPGLPPSTDLTKILWMHGIRVTLRDEQRKSRKEDKDILSLTTQKRLLDVK